MEGLDLDPSQYGTATEEEGRLLEECYSESTDSAPLPNGWSTFDELYAYRECAVSLGIESKVLKFEPADEDLDEDDSHHSGEETADFNRRIELEADCLRAKGWKLSPLPENAEGVSGYEVVDLTRANEADLVTDAEECHLVGHEGDGTAHSHDQ